jgi:hypothetical protein
MKNRKHTALLVILAVFTAIAISFALVACQEPYDSNGNNTGNGTSPDGGPITTSPVFSAIDEMRAWLEKQPANASYRIKLNIDNVNDFTKLSSALKNNANKYVYLDLSGSYVTEFPRGAFSGCVTLTEIIIPNSVTNIRDYAFEGCTSLTAINTDTSNIYYSTQDGVLYNKDKTTLVIYPPGKTGAFTIPSSVTSIGKFAFCTCTSLTSVTIPNSVTSIGWEAFSGCTSLTSVTIPNSVTSIGWGAFSGCTSLTSVTIPNSVTSIGWEAFSGCTSLASVTIPSSVTSIGDSAFNGCTSLASVTIPSSLTSIGWSAFSNCTSLASVTFQGNIDDDYVYNAFFGDLGQKYQSGGTGTYKTTATVSSSSVWTKQ